MTAKITTEKRKQITNLTKNVLMEFKGLTELEFQFIYDLSCSDFAFECGVQDGIGGYVNSNEGFDMSRVRGVMSSLIQKGYIQVDDAIFGETWVVVTDMEITEAIFAMWYPSLITLETIVTEVA